MAEILADDTATTEELLKLYEVSDVPDREPTNDGPDDDGFSAALRAAENMQLPGMFPSAGTTALREYDVKR